MTSVDALYASLLAQTQQPAPIPASVTPLQPGNVPLGAMLHEHTQSLDQQRLLANLQALILQQQAMAAQQQKLQAAVLLNAASSGRMPHPTTNNNNPTAARRVPTPPPKASWNIRAGPARPAPPAPPAPRSQQMSPHAQSFQPAAGAPASRFWGAPASPATSPPGTKQRNGIPPPPPRAFMHKPPPPPSPPASVSSRASSGDIIDQLPEEWEY